LNEVAGAAGLGPTLDQWLAARRRLLDQEKELTRLRDRLAAERRAMPWLRIEKDYRFDGPEGPNRTLAARTAAGDALSR